MARGTVVSALIGLTGLCGCTLTAEEQAILLSGFVEGLASANTYAPGYNFGGVPGRSIQLCAKTVNGRGRIVFGSIRSGHELNQAVGGNVYRVDRNYVTIPTAYGAALIAIPSYASFAGGPVYGRDQQGITWVLSSPQGCY